MSWAAKKAKEALMPPPPKPPVEIPPPEERTVEEELLFRVLEKLKLIEEYLALNNRYKVWEIDLTVARKDEPLGLKPFLDEREVPYFRFMLIEEVPVTFYYRLNTRDAPLKEATEGAEWEFPIEEIYITNEAAPANTPPAKIHLEWLER